MSNGLLFKWWYKNRTEKACLWSKMSGILMVRQVIALYHLNTRHPCCPVFRCLVFRWLLNQNVLYSELETGLNRSCFVGVFCWWPFLICNLASQSISRATVLLFCLLVCTFNKKTEMIFKHTLKCYLTGRGGRLV